MTDLRFQNLKVRIYGKSDDDVVALLKPYEVKYAPIRKISKSPHYVAIIKYLFFLYDPNTDLNREFVRLEDRKQEAAKLSGLIKITDLSYLDRIFNCTHPETLDVIQVLLTEVYHDISYREWQTLQNELDEYTSARWEKIESKRRRGKKGEEVVGGHDKSSLQALELKAKLREECQKIIEKIKQYEQEIFGDNKDVKEIAYKSRFTNPESFSRAIKQAI